MVKILTVYVAGLPRGQPRARHVPAGKGKFRIVSTQDKGIKLYREQIMQAMRLAIVEADWPSHEGAYRVDWTAWFATKKADRWGKICTKKPDRDNLDKLILDCAGDKKVGLFPKGDERAGIGTIEKRWSKGPGLLIEFTILEEDIAPVEYDDDDDEALGVLVLD